jgi:phospholipid transport system substrate-binding protein
VNWKTNEARLYALIVTTLQQELHMKKLLPFLLALLIIPVSALAQYSAPPVQHGPQNTEARPSPDQILRMGIRDLQDFLLSDQAGNTEALVGLIAARIAPQFDIDTLARWSGGYWYQQMDEAQRVAFTTRLAKSFFSSLSEIVGGYTSNIPEVRFMAPRRISEDEVDVSARILQPNKYPIDVRFSFHRTPRGWLIFDVSTNGVSAVNYYRSLFNRLARQGGIEALY